MPLIDTDVLVSVSEAQARLSRLVTEASQGRSPVLTRNNKPVAVILDVASFAALQELERTLRDYVLVQSRRLTGDEATIAWSDFVSGLPKRRSSTATVRKKASPAGGGRR